MSAEMTPKEYLRFLEDQQDSSSVALILALEDEALTNGQFGVATYYREMAKDQADQYVDTADAASMIEAGLGQSPQPSNNGQEI